MMKRMYKLKEHFQMFSVRTTNTNRFKSPIKETLSNCIKKIKPSYTLLTNTLKQSNTEKFNIKGRKKAK